MNDVAEPVALSPERVLTGTILSAFPWSGERRSVPATSIPPNLWTELVPAAKQNGLAALFFASLSETADPHSPAEPIAELRDIYLRSRIANRMANDTLGGVLEAFAKRNVPMLILKGAALSAILYPEPGLRPFGDLDLLIHRPDLALTQSILSDRGFDLIGERHKGFSGNYLKSLNYAVPGAPGPSVDLHWHLFAPAYYRRRIAMDWFWQHPLQFTLGGHEAYALAPLQQLVHLTAHAGLHHAFAPIIWWYDMTRWIQCFQAEIHWDEFVQAVQRLELASSVAGNLARAVDWWGARVPPGVIEQLAQTRSGAGARLVYAIYASRQGGARSVVDMLYQEGLSNKVGYAAQMVLPSREYMETRKPSGLRGGLPVMYAQRVWRIMRYVTGSLWGMLTGAGRNK